jgi:hypothetical protein
LHTWFFWRDLELWHVCRLGERSPIYAESFAACENRIFRLGAMLQGLGSMPYPPCGFLLSESYHFLSIKKTGKGRRPFPVFQQLEPAGQPVFRERTKRGSPDPGKCPRRPFLLPAGDDGAAARPLESGKPLPGPPPLRRKSRTPPKPPGSGKSGHHG